MVEPSAPRALVSIVGLHGGAWFGAAAEQAIREADVLVGSGRHLMAVSKTFGPTSSAEELPLFGPLDEVIDVIEQRRAASQRVTMLASGDPGFFGIERLLVGRFGQAVQIFPAPSSVALAFASARMCWDDAAVVSCHGRTLKRAIPSIIAAPKVAVLVSAVSPPEAVGRALVEAGSPHSHAWVCSRLGEPDESITRTDLAGLATGKFDPLSVLILATDSQPVNPEAVLAWGRPISSFGHRQSLITKPEVRAVVLSKLELKGAATLWDVGAGSGSVAIEATRLAPGLRAFAIEQNAEDCSRIRRNATRAAVTTVEGVAPGCFAGLAAPDRIFVGGGGTAVLKGALAHLQPAGVVVATFVTLGAAVEAAELLGNMVQLSVNQAVEIGPNKHLRLAADNPVFVVWGSK